MNVTEAIRLLSHEDAVLFAAAAAERALMRAGMADQRSWGAIRTARLVALGEAGHADAEMAADAVWEDAVWAADEEAWAWAAANEAVWAAARAAAQTTAAARYVAAQAAAWAAWDGLADQEANIARLLVGDMETVDVLVALDAWLERGGDPVVATWPLWAQAAAIRGAEMSEVLEAI